MPPEVDEQRDLREAADRRSRRRRCRADQPAGPEVVAMSAVKVESFDCIDEMQYLVRGDVTGSELVAAVRDHLVHGEGWLPDEASGRSVEVVREGWFRMNPCHASSCYDGGGHRCHLGYAKGPGRGNFRGVLVR